MTKILEVWKDLKFVSDAQALTEEEQKSILHPGGGASSEKMPQNPVSLKPLRDQKNQAS